MFRKALAALGLASAAPAAAPAQPMYSPYAEPGTNKIYNLLFFDNGSLLAPGGGESPTDWQTALLGEPADEKALRALAADEGAESRVRYFAYARLRKLGVPAPAKVLLGVIVEVPQAGGLDALAAYADGGVRYINFSGRIAVVEGVTTFEKEVREVLAAAAVIVSRIGPWTEPRLPPPAAGKVRLSFLVSDGLYFGEGPMQAMQGEPMAGALISRAALLLQAIVNAEGTAGTPRA